MRRLYLIASSGHPNFGDEAIVRAWLRWLARHHPDDEVWLDSQWPGSATALFAGEHPRLRCVDTLFELLRGTTTAREATERLTAALRPHGPGASRLHGLRILAGSDVVHMVGGGYANGLWPHQIGLLGAMREVRAVHGTRTAMTGQGLTPLPVHELELLRALVSCLDVADARDQLSAQAVGVGLSGDDVLLDPESALDRDPPDAPSVIVVVQSEFHDRTPDLARAVVARLAAWQVSSDEVAVLECIPGVDRPVFELLEPVLPGCRFIPFVEVWDRGLPVAAGQRWISTRFHPHLLASLAGAAGVAVSVRPDYYDVKHESVRSLGSAWTRGSLDGPLPDVGPAGTVVSRASAVRQQKEQLAVEVYGSPPDRRRSVRPRLRR